jgi:hypothetical protein
MQVLTRDVNTDHQLGNWIVMLSLPGHRRSAAASDCPQVTVKYRSCPCYRARNGHVSSCLEDFMPLAGLPRMDETPSGHTSEPP